MRDVAPPWSAALGCVLALAIAGCGGGKAETITTSAAPIADGRRVFERSGCLACHQLGTRGNSGPGSNLTGVGARMSPAELRRLLRDAPAPMPSYGDLPRDDLDDLVAYLSALRGNTPGGPPCPDDVDCG